MLAVACSSEAGPPVTTGSTDSGLGADSGRRGDSGPRSTRGDASEPDSGFANRPDSAAAPDATSEGNAWSLTDAARRAFLYHYAPLLLVRARGGSAGRGRDWVTNFDFDRDGDFSTNKDNWEDIDRFIDGERPAWDIRPTLYSALIELMTGDRKDLVLLYHVYHAKQRGSIHDWERVELRINGVNASPGEWERVAYVVITDHSTHKGRVGGDPGLHFLETASGSHPLIWQAEGTYDGLFGLTGYFNAELHFVEEPWAAVEARGDNANADVNVNGGGDERFHYAFVPQEDAEAVSRLDAQRLTNDTASQLAAGEVSPRLYQVRRVTYELQDLADVLPTHWEPAGLSARHWAPPRVSVLLEEPLSAGIAGSEAVPLGLQAFLTESVDVEDDDESRNGYPRKHWFWGAYQMGDEGFLSAALNDGAPARRRIAANQDPTSLGRYFHQHDYFLHEGPDGSITGEPQGWLPAGWHLTSAGGFDGRWVQLFD